MFIDYIVSVLTVCVVVIPATGAGAAAGFATTGAATGFAAAGAATSATIRREGVKG